MDIFRGLNERQKAAVLATEGPVLILAGAGSGKTKTIAHRIAYLMQKGVSPKNILAVTFTNKAAHEMRSRIDRLIRQGGKTRPFGQSPFVSTFHSLGVRVLRQSGRKIGVAKNFSILDEEDSLSLIKDCLKNLEIDPGQFQPAKVRAMISHLKNRGGKPENFAGLDENNFFMKKTKTIWEKYESELKKQKSLDFDDLIIKTVELFEHHPGILKKYQEKWKYIHIDEYQDTNKSQWLLAGLLTKKHKNICAVGDDDQSIYAFRGADYKNILNFQKEWPRAKIIALEENYRSTQPILDAANAVIGKNILRRPKSLFTRKKGGAPLNLFESLNETEEAALTAGQIKNLLDSGEKPSSIAVLYRTNFQSRVLEEELLKSSIPYQVLGVKFYERKEVKDILAYVKAAFNPGDMLSVKRIANIPPRGIGKTTFLKFLKHSALSAKDREKIDGFKSVLKAVKTIAEQNPASKALRLIMNKTGYEKFLKGGAEEGEMRLSNLKEMVSLAKKYDEPKPPSGMENLLAEAALSSEQDNLSGREQGVRLMTVHAAKGLEFDNVFVVGLEEGLFPLNNLSSLEEERRLFYVALTRAKNNVYLSFANFRTIFGDKKINSPSRFLTEIPKNIMQINE